MARFIGTLNVLKPDQVLRRFGQATEKAGALHPETISLSEAPTPGKQSTQGRICCRLLLGSTVRHTVLAQGVPLRVDVPGRPSLPPLPPGTEDDPADIRPLHD